MPSALFEDFTDGHVGQWTCALDLLVPPVVVVAVAMVDASAFEDEPTLDTVVPGVGLIPLILFGLRSGNQLRFIEPPDRAFTITRDGFGP